jgi:hypothetical protein
MFIKKIYFNKQKSFQECGIQAIKPNLNLKIVGGSDAVPHSWPWQASVQSLDDGEYSHSCGGSVINNEVKLIHLKFLI